MKQRIIETRSYVLPLPEHTKLDVWECYAKAVLTTMDQAAYGSLKNCDKPDLIDKTAGLGVEVTSAVDQKTREAESAYGCLSLAETGEERAKEERRLKKRLKSTGATLCSGIMFGPDGSDTFDEILEAHRVKLEKLNNSAGGGYKDLATYHLFVRSNILADDEMLKRALIQLIEDSKVHTRRFDVVVVNVPGWNYIFNLKNGSYETIPFTSATQFDCSARARQEVIDRELEERSSRD